MITASFHNILQYPLIFSFFYISVGYEIELELLHWSSFCIHRFSERLLLTSKQLKNGHAAPLLRPRRFSEKGNWNPSIFDSALHSNFSKLSVH